MICKVGPLVLVSIVFSCHYPPDELGIFFESVETGDSDSVEYYLFEKGYSPNLTLQQRTALELAVEYQQYDVAKLLIRAGADVDEELRHIWSPLLRSVLNRDTTMMKLLLDAGADPNIHCYHFRDRTPLILTILNGAPELTKVLLEYGADPYLEDEDGANATDYAQEKGLIFLFESKTGDK